MDKEIAQRGMAGDGLAGKPDPNPLQVGFTFLLRGHVYRVRKVVYQGREIVARRLTPEQLRTAANTVPQAPTEAKVRAKAKAKARRGR